MVCTCSNYVNENKETDIAIFFSCFLCTCISQIEKRLTGDDFNNQNLAEGRTCFELFLCVYLFLMYISLIVLLQFDSEHARQWTHLVCHAF